MATHRRGISATQWSVGDLLRREGRSWPSLSRTARGVAVGSALLASTVVAVSMASEPENPEPPPPPDPAPPSAPAPDTPTPAPQTAPPASDTGSRHTAQRGSPFGAQGTVGGPAVALPPAMPHVPVPHTPGARSALPDLSGGDADDAPVVGGDIVAGALDPDGQTGADDGDRDSDGEKSGGKDSGSKDSGGKDSDDGDGGRHAWNQRDGEHSTTSAEKSAGRYKDSDGDRRDGDDKDKKDRDDKDKDKDKARRTTTGRAARRTAGIAAITPIRDHSDRDVSDRDVSDRDVSDRRSDHSDRDHSDRDHSDRDHSDRDHSDRDHSDRDHSDRDHSDRGPSDGDHPDHGDRDHADTARGSGDDTDGDHERADHGDGPAGRRQQRSARGGRVRVGRPPQARRRQLIPGRDGTPPTDRSPFPGTPGGPSGLHQALADGPERGLGPRHQPQLGEHVGHVGLDRALADAQQPADVAVRPTLGDQHEDVALAAGERGDAPSGSDERVREHAGDGGIEVHLAAPGGPDRVHDLVDVGVLQHVPGRPGLQRAVDAVRLAEAGDDDDVHLRPRLLDQGGGGDAVHAAHHEVHQHDVGQCVACRQLFELPDGPVPVGGLTHRLDTGRRVEERPQAEPDDLVVVDDEDPDRRVRHVGHVPLSRARGTTSRTAVRRRGER